MILCARFSNGLRMKARHITLAPKPLKICKKIKLQEDLQKANSGQPPPSRSIDRPASTEAQTAYRIGSPDKQGTTARKVPVRDNALP